LSKVFVRELIAPADAHWILDMKLRKADQMEFETVSGRPGNEPVLEAAIQSAKCMVALCDGRVIAIWGVWDRYPTGVVWACGTDEAVKHRDILLTYPKKFFEDCLKRWPELATAMDSRNALHERWLLRFGFTIFRNALNINGVPFHLFRRDNVPPGSHDGRDDGGVSCHHRVSN
jgi:hypothetical protein